MQSLTSNHTVTGVPIGGAISPISRVQKNNHCPEDDVIGDDRIWNGMENV